MGLDFSVMDPNGLAGFDLTESGVQHMIQILPPLCFQNQLNPLSPTHPGNGSQCRAKNFNIFGILLND
jgi:hypothetical protein